MSTPGDSSSRRSGVGPSGEPPLTRARSTRDPTPSSDAATFEPSQGTGPESAALNALMTCLDDEDETKDDKSVIIDP